MEDQKNGKQNVTENQKGEGQKIPTPKVKASKSKFDRWKKNEYIQEIVGNIKSLLEGSEILKLLHETLSDNTEFPLLKETFENILRDKKIKLTKTPFRELLLNLHKLEHGCGISLSVTKLADGALKLELSPIILFRSVYKVKGCTIEDVSGTLTGALFFSPSRRQSRCPLKIIEILDITKRGESLFLKLFSTLENDVYPTVIEYRHNDHRVVTDKLLVYMPPQLNASQLFTAYGPQLTRMRDDFYRGVKRGRPPSRVETERKIQRAMSELAAGGVSIPSISMDEIKEEVAKKLSMNEDYIINEYRSVIRAERNIYRSIRKSMTDMKKTAVLKMPEDALCLLLANKTGKSPNQIKSIYLPYVKRLLRPKSVNN